MKLGRRTAAVVATTAVLGSLVAVAVAGSASSSDAIALQRTRGPADKGIEKKVDDLVEQMTLQEKLMQLQLDADWQATDDQARAGLGSVFSLTDPVKIDHLQHVAVEQSRLHIPILFAFDTIHGFRTVFPIPLGQASSFDPSVATADDTIGARESATVGLKQIYSPMVDVSHEARWGRIAEGAGEDPYVGAVFAAARVKAAQGTDYSALDKVVTSVKHFAAYGQPEGGREYNTTDMSEQRLRNLYLPPFKAAIDAGADTVMCSFNAINGVPGCANHETETDILKHEWHFDGFVESDYTAVDELIRHGVAGNGADAAEAALNAGTDSEMVSSHIRDNAEQLLAEHRISMARIDDAVKRILRVKFRAGLFDHPYVDQAKANDPASFVTPADRSAERAAASKSMVLLKNSADTLPLSPTLKTAVIGPLGNDQHDMLGPWWGVGRDDDAVSLYNGIKAQDPSTTFTAGCTIGDHEDSVPADECDSVDLAAVTAAANAADQVVLALGECRCMSGEAESRTTIDLPGKQQEIVDAVAATGKPFVVVLFNGRPLTLTDVAAKSPAILEAWFPGIEAGNAVADVLFGKVNPGGKLPVSFPRVLGQVPIYYNHEPTGRPCDTTFKWNSRYRDLPYCDPLYPFGFGLSYTTFSVTNLHLDAQTVSKHGQVTATVNVTNTGARAGDDVVQLYIHDPVASISQPVRRLRGFQRVTLVPGQTQTVPFTLDASDWGFYDNSGKFVVEPGEIEVYAGDSSTATMKQSFTVTG
ncbi:MAG: beta-glucosidase BglX [Gaiellaceae bacterium]